MRTGFTEIKVATRERTVLVDITGQVEDAVEESGISHGICLIQSLHSTTAIVVNEHESGLMGDITNKIKKDFPKGIGWPHDRIDNHADAHQASTYLGASKVFALKEGRLLQGTWQNIFLVELDGPRSRSVVVEVMGE